MAFTSGYLEVLFLAAVLIIWAMIFYQLFFMFMGLIFYRKSLKEKEKLDIDNIDDLPPVSILIPAHNEELVIRETLDSLLSLDYPAGSMEIIVINDGSTDGTAELVEEVSRGEPRVRLFNVPSDESARGKPHALNLGFREARHEYVAIYDADNTPEASSLRYLITNLIKYPEMAAAFGKFRTRNRRRNLLTRFINMETLSFQLIIQAGRSQALGISILPGTNLVIKKSIIEKYGGWDENALTEDTELSIRLFRSGHRIKFVPYAVTWEEEPEQWRVWVRQRTRWVRGNFYILKKFLIPSLRRRNLRVIAELGYIFLLYYSFIGAILLSHFFFITSGLGLIAVHSPGPYFIVWVCAFLLFTVEIMVTAALEKEASAENLAVVALMYFTYCQGWIILIFRAAYQEIVMGGNVIWEKTPRFASSSERKDEKR
ncbi:MAG: glycosyltransferase family 2 protein [Candidatus Krumholzibacteriota bacterium]|nr:glycosyltransferase family 2 protein [Candidatus Krumholzibacteriota bacterium]